jgi:hypothetical protein
MRVVAQAQRDSRQREHLGKEIIMPDAIANIGSLFSKAAPAITGGAAGAGLIGNILNSVQRGNEVGKLQSAEKKFANLTPEQLSGMVTKAEQPLSQDLLQNVGNLVQADMGTRGLSESPGIFASTETQALAPYKIAEQNTALQLIMKQLGLPIEYAQAILGGMGGPSNIAPLLQLLMKGKTPDASGTSPDIQKLINLFQQSPSSAGLTPNTPDSSGGWLGDSAPVDTGSVPA